MRVHEHIRGAALDVGLVLLVVLVYWPVVSCGPFPWDDAAYWSAVQAGPTDAWRPLLGNVHPLTMLALWADHAIGSGSVQFAHFSSLLLHGINAVLVRRLTATFLNGPHWTTLIALVFAFHPLQVESVAWLAERKTLLAGSFLLLCTRSHLIHLQEGSTRHRWFSVAFFTAALLSKPIAVAWPLFLFGVGLWVHGRTQWRSLARTLLPLVMMALGMAILTILAQQQAGFVHLERSGSQVPAFMLPFIAYGAYPIRMLIPYDLSILHPLPAVLGWKEIMLVLATMACMAWSVHAWRKRKDRTVALVLMYTATILPVIHLVPFGSMITADRYAYLALLPVAIGVLRPLQVFAEQRSVNVPVLCCIPVVMLAMMTHARGRIWCTSDHLFAQAVAHYPWSAMAHANLAGEQLRLGRLEEAGTHLRKAQELDPTLTEASISMAQLALVTDRAELALDELQRVQQIAPDHPRLDLVCMLQARALNQLGRYREALAQVATIPDNASAFGDAQVERGLALAMLNDHEQAIQAYNTARSSGISSERLLLNLAISLGWTARYAEAIAVLNTFLLREPDHPQALYLRGIAHQRIGSDGCGDLHRAAQAGHPTARQAMEQLCRPAH